MPQTILILVFLAMPLVTGLWWLVVRRGSSTWGATFLRGFGWVALAVLPAVVVQYVQEGWTLETLLFLPVAWWVLLGGASVQAVFEATVRDLLGSRQVTMDHPGWYLLLAAVQAATLASVVAVRFRRGARWTDPVVLVVGGLVLLNAILGVRWMWWGT